ncbi:MAG: hypothetical protein VCC36_00095 [Gammaproteobacteria bacterium]
MRQSTLLRIVIIAGVVLANWSAECVHAQPNQVTVIEDDHGWKLQVDGSDFMVFGMNWGYIPIGENYRYSLWNQSDEFIVDVLNTEMAMLRDMGVNAIRLFDDIPPRWVEYIYARHGIMTAINHLMGRYGFEVEGAFLANTDYGAPATRQAILDDLQATIETYTETRGVLMYLLGNENNYGLSWTSFEIESLPDAATDPRAEHLYTLMGEAATLASTMDENRPVALVNGDINYLEVIARNCTDLDILGANVYRGASSGDLFERVAREMGIPFMYTEFGADAYDARRGTEDDVSQAGYLLAQWKEIYQQSYGKGGTGASIGGFIFQWSDGWWKFRQEENLDVHDTNASWATGAYTHDFVDGANNMNEEWWGIAAKNWPDATGFFTVTPRTAYHVLKEALHLDPYGSATTVAAIADHFDGIGVSDYAHHYSTGRTLAQVDKLSTVHLSNVRMHFTTSISNGDQQTERGKAKKLGHTESFWTEFELNNRAGLRGSLSLHGVGSVAQNRLDNLFYENRTLEKIVSTTGARLSRQNRAITDRFAVYSAAFTIEQPEFDLHGFFRMGHFHWGYEGDFFGLYPEAYYGPNLDIYNGQAPNGFELAGKGRWDGLKMAIGPELWWGANAALLAKYYKSRGNWTYALVHHEDLVEAAGAQTSFAVPEPLNRRSAIYVAYEANPLIYEVGAIFSGSTKIGDRFYRVEETAGRGYLDSGYNLIDGEIRWSDTFGGRARVIYEGGALRWYGQGSLLGVVADGGYDAAILLTGWSIKESGRGNHWAVSSGASYRHGLLEIAPQVLYQQPLIPANPKIDDHYSDATDLYYPAVRPRNVLDDPFFVRDNRETLAFELLLVYDPTPGTWFHTWDRVIREDAPFVAALDIWYRNQPGIRDANTYTLASGTVAPFGAAPAAQDEWEIKLHTVHNLNHGFRMATTVFGGEGEPRGDDDRLIARYGGDIRIWWQTIYAQTQLHIDDWGPYDFHRDFNLTYPLQWYADLSYGLKEAKMEAEGTRFGIRAQWRTLDEHSPEFLVDPNDTHNRGVEFEFGTYIKIGL